MRRGPNSAAEPAASAETSRWGASSLVLSLAGERIRLDGLSDHQAESLTRRHPDLALDPRAVPARQLAGSIELLRGRVPERPAGDFTLDGAYAPRVQSHPRRFKMAGEGFLGSAELDPRVRGTVIAEDEHLAVQPIVLENYLRVLVAHRALARGGLLLHCATVVATDRAYLFIGRSGAGKTTLSRSALAAGYDVLSDDAAVVMPGVAGFEVGYVPFTGELGDQAVDRSSRFPIAALAWLRKTRRLELHGLSAARRVSRVVVCCPFVNHDPDRLDELVSTAHRLVAAHPMVELGVRAGEPFGDVLELLGHAGPGRRDAAA